MGHCCLADKLKTPRSHVPRALKVCVFTRQELAPTWLLCDGIGQFDPECLCTVRAPASPAHAPELELTLRSDSGAGPRKMVSPPKSGSRVPGTTYKQST